MGELGGDLWEDDRINWDALPEADLAELRSALHASERATAVFIRYRAAVASGIVVDKVAKDAAFEAHKTALNLWDRLKREIPERVAEQQQQTTWRTLIAAALAKAGDEGPVLSCTLSDAELDARFEPGYGGTEGKPFLAWTEDHVLFPVTYDGSEWAGTAPRNPQAEGQEHLGGW